MVKVLLVDDQKLILEAWKTLLNTRDGYQVVKTASNVLDAVEECLVYRPDVVLLDINLKGESGLDACEQIVNQLPKTKVIGLSLHDKVAIVQKLIAKGASGYLTKNIEPDELITAIDMVMAGNTYICKEMQEKFVNQMMFSQESEVSDKELTFKEIEILKLIAQGLTSKEIADQIFVSPRTVETHRHNILKKLDLPNTARLIAWAIKNGYLD